MNDQLSSQQGSPASTSQDIASALFAQLILQQTNMAMMLLGKVAHPESGQVFKDLEAARLFIDQLEMLETKTKGNLTKEESGLLKQSLMSLRLAFVEVVDAKETGQAGTNEPTPSQNSQAAKTAEAPTEATTTAVDDEHRKKFTKKY